MSRKLDPRLCPAQRFLQLFPEGVAGSEWVGEACESDLLPAEGECIRQAIPARRVEFAAGRLCARTALGELGALEQPLLIGARREPLWPEGFVGSITHTRGCCAAVAARRAQFAGIGIDVERREALDRDLEQEVCTAQELDWLLQQPAALRPMLTTLLFSAKEAFFKCQSPITGEWLGFTDVTLHIDLPANQFSVSPRAGLRGIEASEFSGRFSIGEEHLFTGIGIAARADR